MREWFQSGVGLPITGGGVDSSIEIRRILLLTRLRAAREGMTMQQIVKDCGQVPGWNMAGSTVWDVVRLVLQSLIDDGLASVKNRFALTAKGLDYLESPLKWRIDQSTAEEVERKLFWDSIQEIFDKAYRRLRPKATAQ